MPILLHVMKIYSAHGINEFVICCGYKGYVIKEFFSNYFLHMSDVTFDMSSNQMHVHNHQAEPWKVTLVDTGQDTLTGGRLKRVAEHVQSEDSFCFTYGDGVSNVNITRLIRFHMDHGASQRLLLFSHLAIWCLDCDGSVVTSFVEKPLGDVGLINGGFFVLKPDVLNLLADDTTSFENGPLAKLASMQQIRAYNHSGFWHPMDTLRDKNMLNSLWLKERAPWKVWD